MELDISLPTDSRNIETSRKLHCSSVSYDLPCFLCCELCGEHSALIINIVFVAF